MAFDESLVLRMQQETSRGDEVQRLFEALLKEVTDPARGGLAGFLAHFTGAGLSRLVESWLAHDPYAIASAPQVRYALGDALLARLAGEAGVSVGTAARILALMIPRVVFQLTPGGRVPDLEELNDLRQDGLTAMTTNRRQWLDRLRTPAVLYGALIVWVLMIALVVWWLAVTLAQAAGSGHADAGGVRAAGEGHAVRVPIH
jgi:OOP family OmpA-OmpF porin